MMSYSSIVVGAMTSLIQNLLPFTNNHALANSLSSLLLTAVVCTGCIVVTSNFIQTLIRDQRCLLYKISILFRDNLIFLNRLFLKMNFWSWCPFSQFLSHICTSSIVYGKAIQKNRIQNAWAKLRSPNTCIIKNHFWEFATKCRL